MALYYNLIRILFLHPVSVILYSEEHQSYIGRTLSILRFGLDPKLQLFKLPVPPIIVIPSRAFFLNTNRGNLQLGAGGVGSGRNV